MVLEFQKSFSSYMNFFQFCGGVVELKIRDIQVSLWRVDPKLKRGYFNSPLYFLMYQEEAGDVEPRFKGKRQGVKEKISRARHREILTIDLNTKDFK